MFYHISISTSKFLKNTPLRVVFSILFSVFGNVVKHSRSHVDLIAHLREHCTGIAEVMGSNPAHSLNFSGLCSVSVAAALALMTVITQLLRTKLISFFTIGKIFVYKHCFCYLNVENVKQKDSLFHQPIALLLAYQ